MTTATQRRLSFEDYLEVCLRTDDRCELVRGELRTMNPPNKIHYRIAKFLERLLDEEIERCDYDWEAFRELGQRTQKSSSRLPDVVVVQSAEFDSLPSNRSAILQNPSLLLIEIVSPSNSSEDYEDKREEYQAIGVPEYWIINALPKQDRRVTVCILQAGKYQEQDYRGDQLIQSLIFQELRVTAAQILNPPTQRSSQGKS